ncbi:hypothetical protein KSI01_02960 [Kurthia sibirica]|nr:hypothetical protein KSI01_02960 [Kurthia sibirica]
MLKLISIYVSAIIICSLLFAISLSPIFIFLILFTFVFSFTVLPYFNIIHWTKDIKKVDHFLQNNRRKLLFDYSYAVAHESKDFQRALLEKIIALTKHPNDLHNYRALLAILDNDYDRALSEAMQIKDYDLRHYTMAQAEILRGHFDEALRLRDTLKKPWMTHALDAKIAYESCLFDDYKMNSTLAINRSRGLQRYMLSHSFRQYI